MYIKPLMPSGLASNVKIMPQYFQDAGYKTHAIGKWHLGFCHQNYTPTFRSQSENLSIELKYFFVEVLIHFMGFISELEIIIFINKNTAASVDMTSGSMRRY